MTNIEAIDILIQRLNETPLLSKAEAVKRHETFQKQVIKRMMTERVTYGVASHAPEHLNQTESKFRQTIKDANNDLLWQINVFNTSLDSWFQHGEYHPPYYPWRIAVILSKQKLKAKEKEFLTAYCRHFRGRIGNTDEKIDARANKLGA